MSDEQNIAYLQSQVACAMIEAMGMQAENQIRMSRGESLAYGEKEFWALTEKYPIHHNAAMETMIPSLRNTGMRP